MLLLWMPVTLVVLSMLMATLQLASTAPAAGDGGDAAARPVALNAVARLWTVRYFYRSVTPGPFCVRTTVTRQCSSSSLFYSPMSFSRIN